MQSDFGGAEANIERIMLLANPVQNVNNANDEEALSRCKRANFKSFDLRNHFSYPLDIDIFNRGDIEIFGQYIIQEKLRWKIV